MASALFKEPVSRAFIFFGEPLRGLEPVEWTDEFRIIPVPGHTRGHLVLLYRSTYLFTGDHLEWDRDRRELGAYKDYCWYSWTQQTKSMGKLARESFEWVLPQE